MRGRAGYRRPADKLITPSHPPPGATKRKRFRFHVDYELVSCGFSGHELIGRDAKEIRPSDEYVVRTAEDGWRWHRCIRCDSWVLLEVPTNPTRQFPPEPDEIVRPVKGRRLRDRYVLRLIVIDRAFHFLLLVALAVAVFLFAQHKTFLHHDYVKILTALQGSVGGPTGGKSAIVRDLNKLFKLSTTQIYLVGAVLLAYAVVLLIESVGLWRARRWAEYLTFIEAGLLVPLEIYELTGTVTPLKIAALVINVLIVLYLLIAHRLFGVRGGKAAALAAYGEEG